ncbi:MAG: hypothetical protein AB1765_11885 [Candidatus Hydrogenedentota bacterium]
MHIVRQDLNTYIKTTKMLKIRSLDKLFNDNGYQRLYMGKYPYVMTFRSIAKSLARYPLIGRIAKKAFNIPYLTSKKITISLPGEMFAIYKKVGNINEL